MKAKELIHAGAAEAVVAGFSKAQYLESCLEAFLLMSAKSEEDCRAEAGAARIVLKVREGRLDRVFSARAVYRSQWAGLHTRGIVRRALNLLVARGVLSEECQPSQNG